MPDRRIADAARVAKDAGLLDYLVSQAKADLFDEWLAADNIERREEIYNVVTALGEIDAQLSVVLSGDRK